MSKTRYYAVLGGTDSSQWVVVNQKGEEWAKLKMNTNVFIYIFVLISFFRCTAHGLPKYRLGTSFMNYHAAALDGDNKRIYSCGGRPNGGSTTGT